MYPQEFEHLLPLLQVVKWWIVRGNNKVIGLCCFVISTHHRKSKIYPTATMSQTHLSFSNVTQIASKTCMADVLEQKQVHAMRQIEQRHITKLFCSTCWYRFYKTGFLKNGTILSQTKNVPFHNILSSHNLIGLGCRHHSKIWRLIV